MTSIKAEYFPLTNTKTDFCDIARVSFARKSNEFSDDQNNRLVNYLKTHNHWTAFGHNRITLEVKNIDLAPFALLTPDLRAAINITCVWIDTYIISNSVWGWYKLLTSDYKLDSNYPRFKNVIDKLIALGFDGFLNYEWDCEIPFPIIREQSYPNWMEHDAISFRCSAPMFVARQLGKHQISFCWNEESRRYISNDPEFYVPENFRRKPEGSIKQGSGGIIQGTENRELQLELRDHHRMSLDLYKKLLEQEIAPEMARSVLPQSTMVNWIWTATLTGWSRMLDQRLDSHAQYETRLFAEQVESELKRHSFI